MKVTTSLISKVSTLLGLTSRVVAESLGVIKLNRKKIASLVTTKEVLDALGDFGEHDTEKYELLFKQWDVVAIWEALDARDVDEARKVFDENKCDAEIISEGCLIARIRWDRFSLKEVRAAKTIEQIQKANDRAPSCGRANKLACRKWDILSAKEVRTAQTLKQLKKAYRRARNGSGPRRSAIRKIASLFDTSK